MKKAQRERKVKTVSARAWKIHVSFESRKLRMSGAAIRRIIRDVLCEVEKDVRLPFVNEVNVLFVNDARMREINFEFRKKDKPTDVLSFPQYTPRQLQGRQRSHDVYGSYLGDLVISTETTKRQAAAFGVTQGEELVRLIVHGILHLCGYDHEGVPPKEAQRMRRRERAIRGVIAHV